MLNANHHLILAFIVSATAVVTPRIAMAERREPDAIFKEHQARVVAIAGADSGGLSRPSSISIDETGKVFFWDISSQEISWRIQVGSPAAEGYAYFATPQGANVFSVLRRGSPTSVYDIQTGSILQTLKVPHSARGEWWITGAFSPDARRFAISSDEGDVRLFDVETGLQTAAIEKPHHDGDPLGGVVAFSRDGLFLTVDSETDITIYNAMTLSVVKSIPTNHLGITPNAIFSKDMRLLAVASETKIYIFNTETLETIFAHEKPLQSYPRGLFTSAMEFDSQSLNLHIWHISLDYPYYGHYEIINTLSGVTTQSTPIDSAVFNPDLGSEIWSLPSSIVPTGRILLTGGGRNGTNSIAIWNLPLP